MIQLHWRIQRAYSWCGTLRVPILLFRHIFFLNVGAFGVGAPPHEVGAPPTGKPGSATELFKEFYVYAIAEKDDGKDLTPVIVGSVVGGLLLIVLVVLIIVLVTKSKEPKSVSPSPQPSRIGTSNFMDPIFRLTWHYAKEPV